MIIVGVDWYNRGRAYFWMENWFDWPGNDTVNIII